jgi:hypothetical protein
MAGCDHALQAELGRARAPARYDSIRARDPAAAGRRRRRGARRVAYVADGGENKTAAGLGIKAGYSATSTVRPYSSTRL